MNREPRVMFVTTSDQTMGAHVDGLAGHLTRNGLEVILCSDDSGQLTPVARRNSARSVVVAMERDPAPAKDLRSLVRLFQAIRRVRPDVVVYGTPKAALLAAVASWLARVPARVHVLHGLRVETMRGAGHSAMVAMDRLVERLSTVNLAVGHGLARKAIATGSMRRKPRVLGHGSAQGVDFAAFPRRTDQDVVGGFCVGFVGRVTADKGIDALCDAFDRFAAGVPAARLRLVGEPEGLDALKPRTRQMLSSDQRVEMIGGVTDVAAELAQMSVLCLPTRREGLPTILLEAAAAGVPIIASRATGVTDVVDERSAWLVPTDDPVALTAALRLAHDSDEERNHRADAAYDQTLARFERHAVWEGWLQFLASAGDLKSDRAARPADAGGGGSR